ncbi:THAP domain-containing protein 4-like [Dendronephthya gigantea]|uniref:THAP domain-containing protein 4-like n=1 Tax=Dendronephthya gigantea TaxID=151771 RepID=UPI00106B9969|nr:THAP domain-containing protein 4-like [Dendronephthya gigantea]
MSACPGNKLSWLIGIWKGKGIGTYPTIEKPFEYLEEIEFSNDGIPFIDYKSKSWNTDHTQPMHWESGFIRLKPDSKTFAFLLSHNFGMTEVVEGETNDEKEIHLFSSSLGRMSFASSPHVIATERVYKSLGTNKMEYKLYMATENQPMSLHLHITYDRL